MIEPEVPHSTGIAIVGMSVRLPGAATPEEFWRNLAAGVESISRWSAEELAAAGVDSSLLADPRYVRAKGVLAGADLFDAELFRFTPREAEVMDPQHRVLLECAWEALEHAGYDPTGTGARTGVYTGANLNSYLINNLLPRQELLERVGGLQVVLLNNNDFLATRISYALDLRGPSVLVQTACSTALMAVHMACQALLGGECDLALAGGVSISVPQLAGYLYQEGGVMAPDGRCRAFDERAAGSVEGEGAGIVVLKRLADARRDGDTVHAVILGSAANNDGAAKVGFTAPSVSGQAEAIAEGLAMAGVEASTIGYVEAHGSGTPMGDPIEIEALTQAFRAGDSGAPPVPASCAVGSVKTNVGHLNTAAGIAGLVKATLALSHEAIPPSLHFESPNPQIDFAAGPFYVPTALTPWPSSPRNRAPRRAGVSSFGLGGTNVHVVLEEAPAPPAAAPAPPWQLLLLSARSEAALQAATANLAEHLRERPDLAASDLADIAHTLHAGRRAFPYRRAVVARDRHDAITALVALSALAPLGTVTGPASPIGPRDGKGAAARPVAFLFPGLGDHYVDMGRELYASEAVFRREVDRAAELLEPRLGEDVRAAIFAGPGAAAAPAGPDLRRLLRREGQAGQGGLDGSAADAALQNLSRTVLAQPALFVIEHALARLLMSWDVRPAALIGYSIGEYVAACLAGVLSLADALTLVAGRARLIAELPVGAMLAVPLPEAEVGRLLAEMSHEDGELSIANRSGGDLSIAATNGPHLTVVAGSAEAVARFEARLGEAGATSLRLHATHAFHSEALRPAVEPLLALARTLELRPPEIPYLSNVTGTWITAAEATDPAYWARHMVGTVRFAEGLGELLADPERILLEVGPGSTLSTLARQHPAVAPEQTVVTTMRRAGEPGPDRAVLLRAAGQLWQAGVELDAAALHRVEGGGAAARRRRMPLPTYPFERRRHWIEAPAAGSAVRQAVLPAELGNRAELAEWFYLPTWRGVAPALAGRRLQLAEKRCWLVLLADSQEEGFGRRLVRRLHEEGQEVVVVVPGESFRDLGEGFYALPPAGREGYEALLHALHARGLEPTRAVHLWSARRPADGAAAGADASGFAGADPAAFAAGQKLGLLSLLRLADSLGAHSSVSAASPRVRLLAVTAGTQAVERGDVVDPARATLLGAIKVIPQELPRVRCRAVDVALPAPGSTEEGLLVEQILAEMETSADLPEGAALLALRGRRRLVRAWEPLLLPPLRELPEERAGRLRRGGVYAITTAAHGIAAPLAESLRRELDARIVLLARPEAPADPRLAALAAAEPESVLQLAADLTSPAALRAALAEGRRRFGTLHGIFHAVDSFSGGLLQLKTAENLSAVFGPQVQGAFALVEALEGMAAAEPLDFLVLSGSTATQTGGFGQVDHAAAGACLGALAESLSTKPGGTFTVAVDWDPYQWGSWLAAGLAGTPGFDAGLDDSLERFGVAPARSLEALSRLLGADQPRLVVSAQDLAAVIAQTDSIHAAELLAEMSRAKPGAHAADGPYAAPGTATERALASIWEELFGIERIGTGDDFLALGGHSLLAIQLLTQVRNQLAVDLPVATLFEHPTIADLARVVDAERAAAGLAVDPAVGPAEDDLLELDDLLAEVESMSPAEAARLLEEERRLGAALGAAVMETV